MSMSKCRNCGWSGNDNALILEQAGPGLFETRCPACKANKFLISNCGKKGKIGNGATCGHYLESGICSKSETCPSQVFGRVNPGGLSTIAIPVLEVDEEADQRVEDYFAKKGK